MSFIIKKGKVKVIDLPVTPSLALAEGTLVEFTSGKLAAADDNEAAADIVGVLGKTIASTDSDYADDRLVPVIVSMERHTIGKLILATYTLQQLTEVLNVESLIQLTWT